MRELERRELDQVSGGVLNLGTGAAGALAGGLVSGASYAYSAGFDGSFTWGGFAYSVTTSAASGFLVGTGVSLFAAGVTGVLPGAHVLGVSMGGAGAALGFTTSIGSPAKKDGGS